MPLRNTTATFTLRVPVRNIDVNVRRLVFCHPWRGIDLFWIVPAAYVVDISTVKPGINRIRIRQAFFEVPTGPSGWQRDWQNHIG